MTTVLAISNQKGGVGKTTTCINLAAFSGMAGRKCLVIDVDPQGNTSSVLTPEYDGPSVFVGGQPQSTGREGVDIIARGNDLLEFDRKSKDRPDRAGILKERLALWRDNYDLVFIDCPPSLTALPLNALTAADGVIIPIQCEYYAMEGLGQILALIHEWSEAGRLHLRFCRILLCMHQEDLTLSRQVASEVRTNLPDQVFNTVIPRDVALAAAPSHNRTIIEHDPLCPGAIAYLEACKELLNVIG
jgi:chromosome partitioning protein